VDALEASRADWSHQRDVSKEAQTAVKAIELVLSKLTNINAEDHGASTRSPGQESEMLTHTTAVAPEAPFDQGMSRNYPLDTAIPESYDVYEWNELFDLDVPWDSWVQI
jgi:hypothetical protein